MAARARLGGDRRPGAARTRGGRSPASLARTKPGRIGAAELLVSGPAHWGSGQWSKAEFAPPRSRCAPPCCWARAEKALRAMSCCSMRPTTHARALRRHQRRVREALEADHRPGCAHQPIAWRLRPPGARRHRRAARRRGDAGAGGRHRQDRRRGQIAAAQLATAPAAQQRTVRLHHRVSRARRQPEENS